MAESAKLLSQTEASSLGTEQQSDAARARLFLWAVAPLWAYLVYYMGSMWFANMDYSYGWVVPLLCAALFWERWKRRPARTEPEAALGPVIISAFCCFGVALTALLIQIVPGQRFPAWIMGLSAIGMTLAALYTAGGRLWVRHFSFPVLFFLIAVPWPGRVEAPLIGALSHLNAAISAFAANMLGSPAIREGVIIRVGAGLVGVDEACSGIRSLQASIMVALFLGELLRLSLLRRLVFLGSAVGVAMMCNAVRTTYLVRTCDLHGVAALNVNHDAAAFVILGVTLAALLALSWVFSRNKAADEDGASATDEWQEEPATTVTGPQSHLRPGAQRTGLLAMAAASVALLATGEGFGAWWFGALESHKTVNWKFDEAPLLQQTGYTNHPVAKNVALQLRYTTGRHNSWTDEHGRAWQLFYFEWAPAKTHYQAVLSSTAARSHALEDCLSNLGVPLVRSYGRKVAQEDGISFINEVQRYDDHGQPMHTLSLYAEGAPEALRIAPEGEPGIVTGVKIAWEALRHHDRGRAEKRVLKCAVWGMQEDEDADALFRRLTNQLIKGKPLNGT